MKLYEWIKVLVCAFAINLFVLRVNAQADGKDKIIEIRGETVRIDSLLKIFSRQTNFEFSFNSIKISPSGLISVPKNRMNIFQWLDQLDRSMGIGYKRIGNHIILIDKSQNKTVVKKTSPIERVAKSKPARKVNMAVSVPAKNEDSIFADEVQLSGSLPFSRVSYVSDLNPASTYPMEFAMKNSAILLLANRAGINKEPNTNLGDGQNRTSVNPAVSQELVPLTKLQLGFHGVGISFQRRMGRKWTIDLATGFGGGYSTSYNDFKYLLRVSKPVVYISLNPRLYYNLEKRAAKGKNTSMNAGNYFGFKVNYTTRNIIGEAEVWDVVLFNLHWGMQRSISKRWSVNGHVGVGYAMDAVDFSHIYNSFFYPALDLRFSYRLNRIRN